MVALLETPMKIGPKTGAERRMFPRKEVHAYVEGKRLDHTIQAHALPHLSLAMRDVSIGGLSAISSSPLAKGERISVCFPAQGVNAGWDAYGRVLRCEPSSTGYRLAVEFDPLLAAA